MTDIVERLRDCHLVFKHKDIAEAADEIERLTLENWQLKGALGYAVPGDIPEGDFKCGLCEAKTRSIIEAEVEIERLRAALLGHAREMARVALTETETK